MELTTHPLTLSSSEQAIAEYDAVGDLLEIFFHDGEATAAVELTDQIILRFDWETGTPISLSIISFSQLVQPNVYGEIHLELLSDEWPAEVQDKIWRMLRSAPLNEFLKVSSYTPAHATTVVPITSLKQPALAIPA